ncbi:hypothetical protein GQ43DRAFT_404132 [Delitschia confertaspora ATCC 74209]|uniref:SNF2 family N-terminal domain protein n=1 Tax=Delitschia confertaspora ATCC 74209 TaxID=1513339 RepID=A0A9P4JGR0_9PLEO|nr:hypothetical protein GQ43DRAFT_404132 [Delitschia confertaspora ATCC 74209]
MQTSPRKHRGPFRPLDNLTSPQKPVFKSPSKTPALSETELSELPSARVGSNFRERDAHDLKDYSYISTTESPSTATEGYTDIDNIGNSSSLFEEDWHNFSTKYQDDTSSGTMVKERDPPGPLRSTEAPASGPPQEGTHKAVQHLTHNALSLEFGKASPLRNPLKKDVRNDEYSHLFNIPKPNQARPEHHRIVPKPPITQPNFAGGRQQLASSQYNGGPNPFVSRPVSSGSTGSSIFEIPAAQFNPRQSTNTKPTPVSLPGNEPLRTIPPTPRAFYSSMGHRNGFQPVNFNLPTRKTIIIDDSPPPSNRTDDADDDVFDPDAAIREEGAKFGAPDPYAYVDGSKANENIKALLEGAFDDEDENVPRTRLRKRKQGKNEEDGITNSLIKKLQALEVKEKEPAAAEEEEEEEDGTVEGMKVKLLPHQVDGVSWMLEKETGAIKKKGKLTRGGILADDMGLGKTIQSLALIISNPRPGKDEPPENSRNKILPAVGKGTLIVAPLALIKQWESEINTKVTKDHSLRVLVHHGPNRTKSGDKLKQYDVVITTYQCLQSEHSGSSDLEGGIKKGCFGVHWYRVILDEAHTIKNRNAKCTKACYDLRAHYRWCLTGTPMQNNLDELQSLIKFLRIKPYDSLPEWKDSITGPMKNGRGNLAMRRLQVFLKAFMKRRTKEVLKKDGALNFGRKAKNGEDNKGGFRIVARNIETIIGEFTPSEREFYDRLSNRAEERLAELMGGEKHSYIGALVLLLRLRQACNHPNLTRSNFKEDKDALTTGSKTAIQSGTQTPRRGQDTGDDMDDLADILGGLSVRTKRCDVCQVAMTKNNAALGAIRCDDCENDLNLSQKKAKKEKKHKKHRKHKHNREPKTEDKPDPEQEEEDEDEVKPRVFKFSRQRRVIIDSDDEEEQGEWIVSEGEQEIPDLGKAGGTDDENADGGGETLDSIDSVSFATEGDSQNEKREEDSFIVHDTDEDEYDEGAVAPRLLKKKVINLVSDDEDASETGSADGESGSESGSEEEEESETEVESDIEYNADVLMPSTKIRQLLRILEKETPDHKVIVFSQFTSMLDLIEPFLRRENYNFTRYDGSMRNDLREASLDRLRNDKSTRVLLCSLKCGSLGLNLTAASRVVIMEPFWNPFVEEQAIDRVHRLNQTVDVTVYRLSIHNSVEERILELQDAKRKLAEAAIEGGKAIGKLSMKDILNLFKRDAEFDDRHNNGEIDEDVFMKRRVLDPMLDGERGGSYSTEEYVAPVRKKGQFRGRVDDGVFGRR